MAEIIENAPTVSSPAPFRWAGETHVGKVRQENEDSYFADPEPGIFIVSDGMGGHRGGALASGIVVEDLPVMIENAVDRLRVGTPRAVKSILERAIAEQSKQLQLEGTSESGFKDMGATLVVALLRKGRCFIANIGDSRAYRLHKGKLAQLTQDHSVVSELIEKGHIEPEEAVDHEARGQITRYVGMEEKARPHVHSFTLKQADRILLCTDGLTDTVPDDQIATILKTEADPERACKLLIAAANNAGGHDNVTTLLIDWLGSY